MIHLNYDGKKMMKENTKQELYTKFQNLYEKKNTPRKAQT